MLFCILLLIIAKLILGYNEMAAPSAEERVIDIGLQIIGLAIAVWSALNIVNSIERKELDELRGKTDEVKKLVSNLKNLELIAYGTFLQSLLRSSCDDASAYFYKQFSNHKDKQSSDYYTLRKIEDLFWQVYNFHNTTTHYDAVLLEKAEEALNHIKDFSTEDHLFKTYLTFRQAEFNYYRGYAGKNSKDKYGFFTVALDLYKCVLPKMNIELPEYSNSNSLPKAPVNSDRKLAIYMANTIGDTHRKIFEMKSALTNAKLLANDQIPAYIMKQHGEWALFYCGCAAKWATEYKNSVSPQIEERLHYFEKYYRNLGVAYEQYDRNFGMLLDHEDVILENYLEAFKCISGDAKTPHISVGSVYHTLLSYLKRYFDAKLKFKSGNNLVFPFDDVAVFPFDSAASLEKSSHHSYVFLDKHLKYLNTMVVISELAMTEMPRYNIPIVMNGFVYTYIVLLKRTFNEQICSMYSEDYNVYLAKIKSSIIKLNAMSINDDYTKDLCNRYCLLKEFLKNSSFNL